MEDVCIVCSRSIELPDVDSIIASLDTSASANGDSVVPTRNKSSASLASSKSNGSNGHSRHSGNGKGRTHSSHSVKLKRNHSSGRLAGKGKSAIKPLTAATSAATTHAKDDDDEQYEEEDDNAASHASSAIPTWMSLYCSQECRKDDELRSRMAVANLHNEQQKYASPSPPMVASASPIRRSSAWSHYTPSSPLALESEGSEFDWAGGMHQPHTSLAGSHSSKGKTDSDSRGFSDGSDSSRVSAVSRTRRSSTRPPRDSSDSLASLQDQADRLEPAPRLSTSRHSGVRAMTPIHLSSTPSPRDPSPRSPMPRPMSTAASMHRSSSDTSYLQSYASSATTTTIPAPSTSTFRPHSLGKGGLKPSKSSATLAMTSGNDVVATLAKDDDYFSAQTYQPARQMPPRLSTSMPRHRSHASNSSIPYLSCSPSSPGSGSLHSARSNTSTAASSSSARGELEQQQNDSYHKVTRGDERLTSASLATYGLFHQRSPSTPSLHTLHTNARSMAHGSSPSGRPSGSRLGSSYDPHHGDGTISQVFRNQRASRSSLSGASAGPASPRRVSFDYLSDPIYNGNGAVPADTTPTASGSTTRASSFVASRKNTEASHEVVHLSADAAGRVRAPSITRTNVERVPSGSSVSSLANHRHGQTLRPALSHRHTAYSDASASSPPSPPLSTPGQLNQRQLSHPSISQLQLEDYALGTAKPFGNQHRSKSRSSFTWDHLPSYVPTYQAMDIDKVKRNKSGTSLHSVNEDPSDRGHAIGGEHQSTIRKPNAGQPKKRLFYFPDES